MFWCGLKRKPKETRVTRLVKLGVIFPYKSMAYAQWQITLRTSEGLQITF